MMTAAVQIVDGQHLTNGIDNLSMKEERERQSTELGDQEACVNHHGTCAICLNKIVLQEVALVKGCEHAYCVTCILQWASYRDKPTCPQCKHPFEFLNVHRSLDGSLRDYMFEESVCLLLRASWFNPLIVEEREEVDEEGWYDRYYPYEDEDDDLDEVYLSRSSNLRLGNRRWGDNGYVRQGRLEARPVSRTNTQDISGGAGPSRERKKKEPAVNDAAVGRRAKRAMKREAANKAEAAKHEQHLARMGRKSLQTKSSVDVGFHSQASKIVKVVAQLGHDARTKSQRRRSFSKGS